MGIIRNVWLAAVFFAILVIFSNAGAQEAERLGGTVRATLTPGKVTGIRTDRLKESQLRAWKSILEIVLAKDGEGHPVHPALYGLYHQVDTSDYEIQVELSMQRSTLSAGGFCMIERHTEGAQKQVVLIRLNLGTIDCAIASELTRRADGFIPFDGLKKKERYAEVLGHELAHVVRLITNPEYRGLYLERQALADAGSKDIEFIRSLTSSIEKPAEAAEVEIWRELTVGRDPKM
jgi:hypothetical protein